MDDQVIDRREIHEVIQQSKWEKSIEGQTWEAPEQNVVLLLPVTVSSEFSKCLLSAVLEHALASQTLLLPPELCSTLLSIWTVESGC